MFDTKTLNSFSLVVESIYDAALEPARWPDAVERIAHLHGSDKALLFTEPWTPTSSVSVLMWVSKPALGT
jgi:hypothetical protein